jgi:hypothetical protein
VRRPGREGQSGTVGRWRCCYQCTGCVADVKRYSGDTTPHHRSPTMTDHCPAQVVELPGPVPWGLIADCRGASHRWRQAAASACGWGGFTYHRRHHGLDHGSTADCGGCGCGWGRARASLPRGIAWCLFALAALQLGCPRPALVVTQSQSGHPRTSGAPCTSCRTEDHPGFVWQ